LERRGRTKFAAGGKPAGKKDLGSIAMTYGNVYVARVTMGAKGSFVVGFHPNSTGLLGTLAGTQHLMGFA